MKRVCGLVFCLILMSAGLQSATIGYSVQSNGNDHLYSIDLLTGVATDLGLVGLSDAEGLAWAGSNLYGIGGTVMELWNLTTPPGSLVGGTGPRSGIDGGLGYNPANSTLYNLNGDTSQSYLYSINPVTGAATLVGSGSYFGDNIAFWGGVGYAIDGIFADSLYTVNLATGAGTLVGSLGVALNDQVGSDFDAAGVLWMLTSGGAIYTVNPLTGQATYVTFVKNVLGAPLTGWEGLAMPDQVIPEPGTFGFLALGLTALGWRALRRRRVE